MLAALPHLASIKLDLDFVGNIGPRQNNVANDTSFGHEGDCEFLPAPGLSGIPPFRFVAGKKSVFGYQHAGRLVLAPWS